ncbi:MAG: GGDEF domain-containing protein [Treponema sp.]|nr:GGDEF domain-containing protein [Treponema sp.]
MVKVKKSALKRILASRRFVKYGCFTVITIVLVVLILSLANYILSYVQRRTFEQYTANSHTIAEGSSSLVRYAIKTIEAELRPYTLNPVIKDGTDKEISELIVRCHNLRPENSVNVGYTNMEGQCWTSLSGKPVSVIDREYYNDIVYKEAKGGVWGPFTSKVSGRQIVLICLPVYSSQFKLRGIIQCAVDLETIEFIFRDNPISSNNTFFVISEDGTHIYNTDKNYLMRSFDPPEWMHKSKVKALSSVELANINHGIVETLTPYGEEAYVFLEPVKDTSWTLGLTVPKKQISAVYNKSKKIKNFSIAITITVGVFLMFLTMIILNKINFWEDIHDPLTGLWTRKKFEMEAQQYLYKNPQRNFVIAEIDFQGFKFINQNYGTEKADQILVLFADVFKHRKFGNKFFFARGYADHFYIFREISSVGAYMEYTEETWRYVEEALAELDIPCYPKCGYTFVLPDNDFYSTPKTIHDLIGDASYAKSTIKENYMYRYCIYSKKMACDIERSNRIERYMLKGLEHNEFYIEYQPKMGLLDDKIHGAEALVRWNSSNPKLGFLSPGEFIPVFEKDNFIVKLDFAVFEMVFKFLREQIDAGNPVVPISVNVSRRHTNPTKFVRDFVRLFHRYNLPPSLIEIELLERADQEDPYTLLAMTDNFHKHGFSVAMDDFGSGHSSLNMLNEIPVDVLKFDQKFLLKSESNSERNLDMITTLVELGKKLNKRTLFEGVETQEQRDFLRKIKCDEAQGYFYSKPLAPKDFVDFVKKYS